MMVESEQVSLRRLRRHLGFFAMVSLFWAALSTWVGWHAVGPGFPDGFQSVGATFGSRPGHLTWPMMGTFEGFDRTWGYHWFGWPMMRSLAGFIVPWTSLGDGISLHLLRALAAVLVGEWLLSRQGSAGAAWIGFLTVLLNRGWFCSMAFLFRPETATALLLWMAALPLLGMGGGSSRLITWISAGSLVVLPVMHPLAWPAVFLLVVMGSLTIRNEEKSGRWLSKACLRWWLPALMGLAWFACYYLADPLRLAQLKDTLQTTTLIRSGLGDSERRLFLDPKNLFYSGPLLVVVGLSLLAIWRRAMPAVTWIRDGFGLSLAMVVLSLVYLLAAGHPNTGHATVMAPFLGYSAGRLFDLDWRSLLPGRIVRLALIGQVTLCSAPLLLTAASFVAHPPSSPRARAVTVLAEALASTKGRVIIPLSLWEAAGRVSDPDRARIRFATFPNWVPLARRFAYEKDLASSLAEGDMLVAETTSSELSDPANLLPWPRTERLRGGDGWRKVADFDPVVNTTLSIGSLHREEMLLGPMALLRYQATNRERP
jgi:hypothetical protein